jgi:hypothetical protein
MMVFCSMTTAAVMDDGLMPAATNVEEILEMCI